MLLLKKDTEIYIQLRNPITKNEERYASKIVAIKANSLIIENPQGNRLYKSCIIPVGVSLQVRSEALDKIAYQFQATAINNFFQADQEYVEITKPSYKNIVGFNKRKGIRVAATYSTEILMNDKYTFRGLLKDISINATGNFIFNNSEDYENFVENALEQEQLLTCNFIDFETLEEIRIQIKFKMMQNHLENLTPNSIIVKFQLADELLKLYKKYIYELYELELIANN